jgi:hypothetical protein
MNRPPRATESSSLTGEHRQRQERLERLWEVWEPDEHTWSARLLYQGEWGVVAQLLRDGAFLMGCLFNTKQEAAAWAAEQLVRFVERHESDDD